MDRKSYREERADCYIEDIKNQTVYELLVLKRDLSKQEEEYIDVSCRASIWHEEED